MRHATSSWSGVAVLLAVAAAARAGDGPAAPSEPPPAPPVLAATPSLEPPFAGVVLGDDVNLRAGPGVNYEVVTKLAGGEKVAVLGEAFGWYLVRAARDVRTYIHKDLVETKGAGVGIVLKDRSNVRSRPAPNATVVGQCGRGDVVRLLDQEGDWLVLAAPAETAFYVHRDLVKPVGGLDALALPAAPVAPADAAPLLAAEKVRRAGDLYQAEIEKPDLDKMDFAAARALYEEALKDATAPDIRRAAEAGLKRIHVAQQIQADYRRRVGPLREMLK